MQFLFSIFGICAALVLCAVSAAINYLFLSSLGKTPLEGHVLAAASASADVLKALLPFFVAWSWQARRFVAAAAGMLVFGFFAGFSLLSAIGFAADNRGILIHERDNRSAAYERVRDMRAYAEARRKALPIHRAAAVVTEEIEGHRQDRRWTSTKACANATASASRGYCAAFFKLRAELAAAQEAERLANEIKTLDAKLAHLGAEGAGQNSDPQVSLLTRITGQGEEAVRLTLIIVVALLVEIGASLGLFLASGHGSGTKKVPKREPTQSTGSIEDFCLERLVPSSSGLLAYEVAQAYGRWCLEQGRVPLAPNVFEATFSDLAARVAIKQINNRYVGIGLYPAPT